MVWIDVSWMDAMFLNNNKVYERKSGLFEHAQSISKWPTRSKYVGNFINFLLYLLDAFSRGLGIDLEGSSTIPPLML